MKFIHTADWHLGKLFYGQYLTDEQEWYLKHQFLPLLDEEKPDVVLLAGDVYDRSVPPSEAVDLFDWAISEIVGVRHIPFLVISGNHDSGERLSFGSRLLASSGLYIAGDLSRMTGPVFLSDAAGKVAFAPLPYIETAQVRTALSREDLHTHEEAEQALSEWMLAQIPEGTRRIAIAHDFVTASGVTAVESDSERPLAIGGAEAVSADIFRPYQYTALGHLHGPQKAGSDTIRYSGSLLKYSFSEEHQKKGAVIGEIDSEGQVAVRFEALSPRRDVRTIQGTLEELLTLDDPAPDDFLQADLMDDKPQLNVMDRLRDRYPNMMTIRTHFHFAEDKGDRSLARQKVGMFDMVQAFAEDARQGHRLDSAEEALLKDILKEIGGDAL